MASLSDLIISHPEIRSYDDLEELVAAAARDGVIVLHMDLKPDYPDTPRDWQSRLELIFYRGEIPERMRK
ncbi:MAG: sulfur relay protein DsrC [Nitratireductor sp.]|nr:sulfur relay protein DsrC [Nitratireductor sp.]MCC0020965.1 sulfur relay protein DsrC [Nitratireductor sp.]